MTAITLLNDLEAKGVIVTADNSKLYLDAPQGVLTPALKDAIREHKPELLTVLSEQWARKASALLSSVDDDDTRVGLREQFEERAGIAEYDGGLPRDEAERIAYEQIRCMIGEVAQ